MVLHPPKFLAKLLQEAEEDTEAAAAARYLTETRRREKLDELARERQAWRMDSVKAAMQAVPEQQQTEASVRSKMPLMQYSTMQCNTI